MRPNIIFIVLITTLIIELTSCNDDFSFKKAEVLISEFNTLEVQEFIAIQNGKGSINGLIITDNTDAVTNKQSPKIVYNYETIIDSLKIDKNHFFNLSNTLTDLPASIYVTSGGYSLFIVNSFNGDFNGFLFNQSKKSINQTDHIQIGKFYTIYNEPINEHWYKVNGGW